MSQDEIIVPEGWELKKFDDVIISHDGKRIPLNKSQRSQIQGKYPYYGASGQVDSINDFKLDGRFLLIAEDGENLNSRKKPIAYIVEGKFWVNNHAHVVESLENVTLDYLCYYINSLDIMKFAQKQSTRPKLNKTDMSKIPIIYPKKIIQKKIVQKLDHILGELEKKKNQIISRIEKFDVKKINENYKNHVLKLAFDGTLTGEESEIIDGIKVPKGWKIKKFKDFTNVIRGSSPRPKGDSRYFGGEIPWIKISDITSSKGKYVFSTKEGLTNEGVLKSRFLKSGTLILTTSMLIAMPKILKMDGCIHDGFLAILDIDKEIDTEFLYYYFLAFRGKIEQQSSEGSAIKNINTDVVKNLEIHIPSLETQKKIVQKLDQKFADWENHKQELENIQNQYELIKKHLNSLSSSILNDAFSGKLVN